MSTFKKFIIDKIKRNNKSITNPEHIYKTIIDKILAINPNKQYMIIGYGSMLNKRSRNKIISQPIAEYPLIIKNYIRIFNLKKDKTTVLNIQPSNKHSFNAVGTLIDYTDMIDIIIREHKYNITILPPEDIAPYNNTEIPTTNIITFAVVCNNPQYLAKHTPRLNYVQANIHGCQQISPTFLEDYLNTTYCYKNNKLITLTQWIKEFDLIQHSIQQDSTY